MSSQKVTILGFCLICLLCPPGAHAENHVLSPEAGSIEGTLLTLDDKTPHVAVVVQVVTPPADGNAEPTVVATTLSDDKGHYQCVDLKPGKYQVRCYTTAGYVYYPSTRAASQPDTVSLKPNQPLRDIHFHFAPFKKGTWKTYTPLDGLAGNSVIAIHEDPEGVMWFGSFSGGVSRYDGKHFTTFTEEDGLAGNSVRAIHQDSDGLLWLGTSGGVSVYDGQDFTTFTTEDGLADNTVTAICGASDGSLWFGTGWLGLPGGGVSRYDGEGFVTFTTEDGLASNRVASIQESSDGTLWFGTLGGGVSVYGREGFANYTIEDGLWYTYVFSIVQDDMGHLWFATYGGVSRYDGQATETFTTDDGLASYTVTCIHQTPDGALWFGMGGGGVLQFATTGVSRYDGQGFVTFTEEDGLGNNRVAAMHHARDGTFWFGTTKGVSRYREEEFVNYTVQDGLVHDDVWAIQSGLDGALWFGTDGGASRYDGTQFESFTSEDGLVANQVRTMECTSDGVLWFGTFLGGVSRYDGKGFESFTTEDGWTHHESTGVFSSSVSADGSLWFGTTRAGASRYDGQQFVNFSMEHGLAHRMVLALHGAPDGVVWFGTMAGGVSRYDGEEFVSFDRSDGLASTAVSAIYQDADGLLWFGTHGGISRYDGREFVSFTTADGLANSTVLCIHRSQDGLLWFGTDGGGVCLYDGDVWSSLDTRVGLAGDTVRAIYEDTDGALWFGTNEGISQYRRIRSQPTARIISATTDQTYPELEQLPALTVGTRITLAYESIDLRTHAEKRQYRCRITGLDSAWRKPTRNHTFEHTFRYPGVYTFEVQSIDRDLNYSQPASVVLTVVNPFYLRAAFLVPTVGGGSIVLVIAVIASVVAIRRRRQVHAYERYAAQELQDARQMQLSLMPRSAPIVTGAEVTGKCVTANTVGGDFLSYLAGKGLGQVGLVVADVSGKAMRGAMNAVMADGILHMALQDMDCIQPARLLQDINDVLTFRMESDMNVTMVIGLLDTSAMTLTLANAAHHAYPLFVRDGAVTELKARGLPLGTKAGIEYREETFDLQPGDIVVLMTDGIIEAHDADGRMYGDSGRLEQVLTGFTNDMSAESMVDALIQDAIDYGHGEREDDMTVVIARIS